MLLSNLNLPSDMHFNQGKAKPWKTTLWEPACRRWVSSFKKRVSKGRTSKPRTGLLSLGFRNSVLETRFWNPSLAEVRTESNETTEGRSFFWDLSSPEMPDRPAVDSVRRTVRASRCLIRSAHPTGQPAAVTYVALRFLESLRRKPGNFSEAAYPSVACSS